MSGDPNRELETTYCGVRSHQWWSDYLVWEKLLNLHPETNAIFEIGTGIGGFALFLSHQCDQREIGFWTFDIQWPSGLSVVETGIAFRRADVFEDGPQPGNRQWLQKMLNERNVILHCDGPDKRREVATFTPDLRPGSLAVVHDYRTEFLDADIPGWMRHVHEDLSEGGLTCILERRA